MVAAVQGGLARVGGGVECVRGGWLFVILWPFIDSNNSTDEAPFYCMPFTARLKADFKDNSLSITTI